MFVNLPIFGHLIQQTAFYIVSLMCPNNYFGNLKQLEAIENKADRRVLINYTY